MAPSDPFPQDLTAGDGSPRITFRALVLGALTIAVSFYFTIAEIAGRGMGGFVASQLPMVALAPFVLWLFANLGLQRLWPTIALRRGELLTIFCMLWVVGTVPLYGWSSYWVMWLAVPAYFASPENQWAETFFDYLPWHVFPESSPRVLQGLWQELPEGADIPWEAWLGLAGNWLGVSVAMVVFGFCMVVLLQRQWEEGEKLTFPLAQLPLDLTAGFDGTRRVPQIFRKPLFWIGFFAVFGPALYNIVTYFTPGLPQFELYWKRYTYDLGPGYPEFYFRVLPLVISVTYLCPLDILGSMVAFALLALLKGSAMQRVGFSLGSQGQPLEWHRILHIESYGAMLFIGLWSLWLARGHLRRVWLQVRQGGGDPGEVRRYRMAIIGLLLSGAYVVAWQMGLGMSLPLALCVFIVTFLTYLVIIKLIAATGCAYLLTDWGHMKAETFVQELLGNANLSPRNYVAFKVFSGRAFFGNLRIPALPSLPHILRIFSLQRQPRWVTAIVFVAFPLGFLVAVSSNLYLGYGRGELVFSASGTISQFTQTVSFLNNPRNLDLDRWGVWLVGFLEAAGLAFMRARFHWFPLHPVGLAFQWTIVAIIYWSTLMIVWIVKFLLLRFGGVRAYLAGKPFFYGLGIGYVAAVIVSVAVDLIWFPTAGHLIHGW